MKNLVNTLSVIILLTSACAKNSNKLTSVPNDNSSALKNTSSATNDKTFSNDLLGSYTVEKFTAKTIDGDFQLTFPGLTETREIALDQGSLVIKQKSVLNGCTRETVSPLDISVEAGVYTRGHFTAEHCSGTCPAKVTGYFQGYEIQDPNWDLACGKNEDAIESGKIQFENGRLTLEVTNEFTLEETLIRNK
jgi:hypothetical protein